MGKMSSLATAFSGMKAAQTGLMVTAHNTANAETVGYVRQQALQTDFSPSNIGSNARGKLQVGLGADIAGIRQIRNIYLDMSYRREASKLGFYDTKAQIGQDLEVIIGELQGEDRMEAIISDLWNAINEISIYQPGIDTRENFMSTCTTFINKVNNVYDSMFKYMNNIDEQITRSVNEANDLMDRINKLNNMIQVAEASGNFASDYRDERNLCLDRLSALIPIEYVERYNQVTVMTEGKELIAHGIVNHIGLKYCTADYPFVEPVITNSKTILPADTPDGSYRPLFNLTGPVDSTRNNDNGKIKALLACRGYVPTNYAFKAELFKPDATDVTKYPDGLKDPKYQSDFLYYQKMKFNEDHAFIPRVMKEFDTLVNSIVTMINDVVSPKIESPPGSGNFIKNPEAPYGLDGSQYDEVFVRKYYDRFTGDDFNKDEINANDPFNYFSLYTMGNIMINPIFSNPDGYNSLALSISGDEEDTRLVFKELLDKWGSSLVDIGNGQRISLREAYQKFINELAVETNDAVKYADRQELLVIEVDNKRLSISGVSLDEEMENMMLFNHAYNASARVVNVLDGMLDKIINGMGRAGL